MNIFLDILTRVTLPIIALVALGWLLQPRLKLDVASLNRLQVYVVMPAFLLHFLTVGRQPLDALWPVVAVALAQFMIFIPLGWAVAIALRLPPTIGPLMGLGTAYANVGFFGIPVTQLAFGTDYLVHQSVLTALVTVMLCTVGIALIAPGDGGRFSKLRIAFETPLIPAILLALLLRAANIDLPTVVNQPLQFIGSIFTPLALYSLGAQVSDARSIRIDLIPQLAMMMLKLIVAPLLTWQFCQFIGTPKDVTSVLVVAASTPVGVLLAVFAAEYRREPEFISTAVVLSTALSPVAVTGWVLFTRLL
jgi:predicted permease